MFENELHFSQSDDTLDHEILHGLFYSNPTYKEKVLKLLGQYDKELASVKQHVMELGYHEAVLLDEVQAYVGASWMELDEEKVSYPKDLVAKINDLAKAAK